ncbi:glycoside hydrolase family 3 C-terminal domain-containing protein [Domibacillus sp. PGB-M46]|uniref:glycoside hydrolase family 3 protein n=1 Tax=Domibacillus sp. PGB-M46 TaxID=2910255 RepID=UPI001F56CB27|nr:glycoside hydrolase family 3 protein [Domibacillus sp. PGB-M46]MCI2255764.1 glycoside hydrolase family 3 C-terminal domain-containing protein [Domibacillus sp. PGB-M46]
MKKTQRKKHQKRKVVSCLFVFGLLAPLAEPVAIPQAIVVQAEEGTIVFKRDVTNMPIFDGQADHLDEFVNLILSEMSNEDLAYYADQKHATAPRKIKEGYTLPATAAGGVDRVMGSSTDFPSLIGLGQSWNKALLNRVGTVIGNERRGEVELNNPNTLMFSVVADLRTNPLSGRFDEGYAEDPVLTGTLINSMAKGITGYGENNNETGFWLKSQLGTKHFTNYLAQWYRITGQFYAGPRAINEYQMKSFLYPLESGLVTSFMTTYGRTNGIPNHISPNIIRGTNANPYSMMPVGDFVNADRQMTQGFNNGYQNYTDANGAAALLLLSGNHANTSAKSYENIMNAVNNGIYGVTRKELEDSVRGQLEMWVRTGYFNEKNEDGSPKNYPFSQLAKDRNPVDYKNEENQSVALQAAREGIVLLKNENNVLPLSKESKLAVTGIFADTRFKATYSVKNTPKIEDAGLSPLGAIRKAVGKENVDYGTGAKIIALESKVNQKAVTASIDETGGQLSVSSQSGAGNEGYQAGGKTYSTNEAFEAYAWGQGGYSYKSLANNKWLDFTTTGSRAVSNNNATSLNLTENPFSNVADASTLPGRFRHEKNTDGTVSLIADTYTESFGGGFETRYYSNGRFVKVNENQGVEVAPNTIGNTAGASARTNSEKFDEIVLKEAGADAQVWATKNDHAVVVVGAPPRHSAGEGADRSDLNLGNDQYEIVDKVAKSFPKKTIVVVNSNFPVNIEAIQKNENVSAILYQPYAGQYDSKALADVLFGDAAPTGRLTTTWYSDTDSFPKMDKYSLPEGSNPTAVEQIDPRFTADMTNGDPQDSGMTYMYTNDKVTYEFGHGLSYSTFKYSNLRSPKDVTGGQPFEVTVDVTNTGTVDTEEVVQLYIKNNKPAYGKFLPKQQLVSYEKVHVEAGKTKKVTLKVDPADFAVWDVNQSKLVTEGGSYTLMAGQSSKKTLLSTSFDYDGESLAKLDASVQPINVYDSTFATKDVVYREVSKLRTMKGLKQDESEHGYYAVMSKKDGSWAALNDVKLAGVESITIKAASTNEVSSIEVRADSPDGPKLADFSFGKTLKVSRNAEGSERKIEELDYSELTEEIKTKTGGYHDLYIVFKGPDIRIDSIQLNKQNSKKEK